MKYFYEGREREAKLPFWSLQFESPSIWSLFFAAVNLKFIFFNLLPS